MGNANSAGLDSAVNKLAIGAMAHIVHYDKETLLKLQKEFHKLAEQDGHDQYTITRESFEEALELTGIHEQDKKMMDRLFVLYDRTGDGTLNFKEFITGAALLVNGTLEERLNFSFDVYDVNGDGTISKEDMATVLGWQSNTASYFGDKPVTEEGINTLVDEIFEEADTDKSGKLSYSQYMHAVAAHHVLVDFVQQVGDSTHLHHEAQ